MRQKNDDDFLHQIQDIKYYKMFGFPSINFYDRIFQEFRPPTFRRAFLGCQCFDCTNQVMSISNQSRNPFRMYGTYSTYDTYGPNYSLRRIYDDEMFEDKYFGRDRYFSNFGNYFGRCSNNNQSSQGTEQPKVCNFPMNVQENSDSYELWMNVPGFGESDLDISVKDNTFTVKGRSPTTTSNAISNTTSNSSTCSSSNVSDTVNASTCATTATLDLEEKEAQEDLNFLEPGHHTGISTVGGVFKIMEADGIYRVPANNYDDDNSSCEDNEFAKEIQEPIGESMSELVREPVKIPETVGESISEPAADLKNLPAKEPAKEPVKTFESVKESSVLIKEIPTTSFMRSIKFNLPIDEINFTKTLDKGVLYVCLPKAL